MPGGRTRLRSTLSALALTAAAWSLLLMATRGVSFTIGPLHVSSRNARNPALAALLLLAIAAIAAPAGARARTVGRDLLSSLLLVESVLRAAACRLAAALRASRRWTHAGWQAATQPPAIRALAGLLVTLTLLTAWDRGAHVAGGSDSYGYVSEAHLFATGRLRVDVPLMRAFPDVPRQAWAPLGYRVADDGSDTLVPTYAPGLPLTMAAAELTGGMAAVYLVMPLLGAAAVWGSYRLGATIAGPGAGLGAALLLFSSPAFAFQLISAPMSDIPAAGWWTLALVLLLRPGRLAMLGAGTAAGAAILTRPNLLFVVVVPGVYLLSKAARARDRRTGILRFTLFSLPVVVACLAVAALNTAWYGSPLRSGYPAGLFGIGNWDENVVQFTRWLTGTQTPLLLVGYIAPVVAHWLPGPARERRQTTILLAGVAAAVFMSYLFYKPYDQWWYLRFLLPGYPMLAVLTCVTLAALAARFGRAVRVVNIAVVTGVAVFGLLSINDMDATAEYRYQVVGEWVRDRLPERAIVVSSQHGGNVMHYGGLPILRYDLLPGMTFDRTLDDVIAAGYRPYLVIDGWEVEQVRQQHGDSPRGSLDWPAVAVLPLGDVRVWDLAEDTARARASGRRPEAIRVDESTRRRFR